jgi:hypothetical protein
VYPTRTAGQDVLIIDELDMVLKGNTHPNGTLNNQSELQNFSFTRWQDPLGSCRSVLECKANFST